MHPAQVAGRELSLHFFPSGGWAPLLPLFPSTISTLAQGRRQMFELAGEILMDKKQTHRSLYNEVSRDFAYLTARCF